MHGDDMLAGGVSDPHGCLLPDGHEGPHEFAAPDGSRWQWETDMGCTCEHCMRCEGDYCTVYWRKAYRETPNAAGNRLARQGQSEFTGLLGPGSEAR